MVGWLGFFVVSSFGEITFFFLVFYIIDFVHIPSLPFFTDLSYHPTRHTSYFCHQKTKARQKMEECKTRQKSLYHSNNRNMEFILCWLTTEHVAYSSVWLIHQVSLDWVKLIFPLLTRINYKQLFLFRG